MSDTFARYRAILADHGLRPFHREPWINPRTGEVEPMVLGERPRMCWRVAWDEWDRLITEVRDLHGWGPADDKMFATLDSYLAGFPIKQDGRLRPGTIRLEADE